MRLCLAGRQTITMDFQLWDAAAEVGQGTSLAAGTLEVDSSAWQPGEEQRSNVQLSATSKVNQYFPKCHQQRTFWAVLVFCYPLPTASETSVVWRRVAMRSWK